MSSKGKNKDLDLEQAEKDIKAAFQLFDVDKNKSLSALELGKTLKSMGFRLTYQEVQLALKKIDKNGNGKIEFGEFRDYVLGEIKKRGNDKERQIRQVFAVFDRDGNGYIDKKELRRAMDTFGEKMSTAELQQMFDEADDNDDGRIDYEEFVELITNKLADD